MMPARIQKKLLHPHESTSRPPNNGPILGANPSAMPAMPMAVAFCPAGKRVMAIVCMTGSMMPVLIACSTRAASNMAKPGARAATRAPTNMNARAAKMSVRTA